MEKEEESFDRLLDEEEQSQNTEVNVMNFVEVASHPCEFIAEHLKEEKCSVHVSDH